MPWLGMQSYFLPCSVPRRGLRGLKLKRTQLNRCEATGDTSQGQSAKAATEPAQLDEKLPALPEPENAKLKFGLIDTATYGVDPVVGRHIDARVRKTASTMGYDIMPKAHMVAAADSVKMAYPPTPADLWRVLWKAEASRGAFARVWAKDGQYLIEITVASLDGAGAFFWARFCQRVDACTPKSKSWLRRHCLNLPPGISVMRRP